MRRFNDYADDAKDFASPYIERTGEFLGNAKDVIGSKYYKGKKKYMRKCKMAKIKNTIDKIVTVILVTATIIATIIAIIEIVDRITKKKCCTTKKCSTLTEDIDLNEENEEKTEKPDKKQKSKNNNGYITL